jgi:quinol monooxygenase YgiN
LIAIIIEFEVKSECLTAFEAKLRADAAETLRDDGCFRMEILKPCGDDNGAAGKFVLSELWRDEAAIAAHRDKPGHSHAWQEPMLKAKRTNRYEVLA